ncbi:MAG: hypothetical protein IKL28_03455 [Lachnospiraceae bacterium]|nr:hypothetical protein [Lachnospiraceae bacterium]
MDLLKKCALSFQKLLEYEYHFVIGRKGQLREFGLGFDMADFHHLAGLHKLKDIAQIQQGMREKIFEKILQGDISMRLLKKSSYYSQMEGRILPLTGLERFLDDNQMIFRYNEKIRKFSVIKADYLLEGNANLIPSYLFLGARKEDEKEQMCRTFFRIEDKDYTEGQPKYTLLKKEKVHLPTGNMVTQFDKLSVKED